MLVGIVATTPEGLIGDTQSPNGLPWNIKKDLKFFKTFTEGKTLIVGGNTFETLPPLSGRNIIVLSKEGREFPDKQSHTVITNLNDLKEYIMDEKVHVVIGGASIYSLLLSFCDYFMVTEIHGDYSGDIWFPIEKIVDNFDEVKSREEIDEATGNKLIFKYYKRRKVR